MALLFLDGFDHYGTAAVPSALGKWGAVTGSTSVQTGAPRTGTHGLRLLGAAVAGTNTLTSKVLPASGGVIVGAAVFASVGSAYATGDLLRVQEGATIHVAVGMVPSGVLTVRRGSTTLATGVVPLTPGSYFYLELKAVIDDAAGSYEVRIDGVPQAELTASGVDTRNGGATGQWNTITLLQTTDSGNSQYWDDLYICDTSGAAPRNTFLGPVMVETLYPQTDAVAAGSNAGLAPSTGTDHGALVDEATPNTTDYNASATVGAKDTYHYPSLSLTGTVLGVQTNLYVAKSDTSARQVCAVVRPATGGPDYDGADVSPLTAFSYFPTVFAQNPATAADWTTGDITSLQAGMKVTV